MKILVADDEQITRLILQKLLTKWGHDVVVATDGAKAYEVLSGPDAPSIAVLDWVMPRIDGVELCRRIRASAKDGYTYVMMLSARGEKKDFKTAMEAGADDYLSKPFDTDELHLRLRAGERIVSLQERLRIEARIDALTGALNRGAIDGLLERTLAEAARRKEPLAVILADIDNFKQVNDKHGHPVGDAVLWHVAECMRSALRPYDALGRYGGEEFMIVAPHCRADDGLNLAERLRLEVHRSPFRRVGAIVQTTVSIGVASGFGEDLQAPDLILLADNALYSAKRNGRNRTELAEATPAVFGASR